MTFTIPVEMSDEDFEAHVHGSGWSTYSWWQQFHLNNGETVPEDAYAVVRAQDPNTDEFVNRSFTKDEIAAAMEKMACENPNFARALVANDLDADAMDLVFQQLAFGGIVYG